MIKSVIALALVCKGIQEGWAIKSSPVRSQIPITAAYWETGLPTTFTY